MEGEEKHWKKKSRDSNNNKFENEKKEKKKVSNRKYILTSTQWFFLFPARSEFSSSGLTPRSESEI